MTTPTALPPRGAALGGPLFGAAALAALLLAPAAPAWALGNGCIDEGPAGGGNCQLQLQGALLYTGWQTQGWAFHCTGDFPYFNGLNNGNEESFIWFNSCFTVTENPTFEEGDSSKFDMYATNWCLDSEDLVIEVACYNFQSGF
jgi:hypothetical protein